MRRARGPASPADRSTSGRQWSVGVRAAEPRAPYAAAPARTSPRRRRPLRSHRAEAWCWHGPRRTSRHPRSLTCRRREAGRRAPSCPCRRRDRRRPRTAVSPSVGAFSSAPGPPATRRARWRAVRLRPGRGARVVGRDSPWPSPFVVDLPDSSADPSASAPAAAAGAGDGAALVTSGASPRPSRSSSSSAVTTSARLSSAIPGTVTHDGRQPPVTGGERSPGDPSGPGPSSATMAARAVADAPSTRTVTVTTPSVSE